MLGYIALGILIAAYAFLYFKKENVFFIVNLIASIGLCIHSILISDIPNSIANGFIVLVLGLTIIRKYK